MEKFAIAAPLCALTRCKICDSGALQWTGSPLSAESRGSCRGSAPFGSFLSTSSCKKNAMKTAPTILKFAIVGPSHSHYIEKVHRNCVFCLQPLPLWCRSSCRISCWTFAAPCSLANTYCAPLSAGPQRHGGGSGLWPYRYL